MKQTNGNQSKKAKRIIAGIAGSLLLLQLAVATPAAAATQSTNNLSGTVVTPLGDTATVNVSWGGCGGNCGQ